VATFVPKKTWRLQLLALTRQMKRFLAIIPRRSAAAHPVRPMTQSGIRTLARTSGSATAERFVLIFRAA